MAGIKINGLDGLEDFVDGLGDLAADINEIAMDCVNETAPTLENALKSNISAAANRGYSTGTLASSIVPTRAKVNSYGVFSAVRPVGSDAKGTRNGEKMAYLEFGTHRQAAHPVMAKSVAQAEPQVTETIRKRFEEQVDKRIK